MALTLKQKAQTAIELAVFGSILIFVLGVIVKSALIKSNEQQAKLRATRMALSLSYNISDPPQAQIASHNNASVLVIEDRLTAASAKYGAIDRSPFMVQASGSHTANLFMPVEYGDSGDLPMLDVYVNGKHFSFTTATFEPYVLSVDSKLYEIVDNHPLMRQNGEWCDGSVAYPCPDDNLSADKRFDLDRDGTSNVPADERGRFSWQWKLVAAPEENISADVDGDLKLEQIEKVFSPTSIGIRDFQNGDIDTTFGESDTGWKPGFTRDARVYTFVHDDTSSGGGTYLQVDEGKLYQTDGDDRQYIRTASKKDTIDVIERVFQLSNNTGRFCDGTTGKGGVEVCAAAQGECYTSANIARTCMDPSNKLLFIRSRIEDFRGRKWVTPTGDDPYVGFGK